MDNRFVQPGVCSGGRSKLDESSSQRSKGHCLMLMRYEASYSIRKVISCHPVLLNATTCSIKKPCITDCPSRFSEFPRFFVTDFLTQERWELDNVSLVLFFSIFPLLLLLSANVLLLLSSF